MKHSFYAPRFDVRVAGVTLAADISNQIISVSCDNDLETASMFRLVVHNADNQFTDSPLFALGKKVEIHLGYEDRLLPMMLGEITGLQPTFPEHGSPTIAITGYDQSYRMRHNQPARSAFMYMNDSLIAAQIALEHGLIPIVDPSPFTHEKLTQTGSDMAFLKERARANFFDVYVHWDKFYFQFPRPHTEIYVLEWGKNLSSFSPRVSSATMAGVQIIRGYSEEMAQTILGMATAAELNLDSIVERLGSSALQLLTSLGRQVSYGQDVKSPLDATLLARSLLQEILDGMYEGSGQCIGIPELRAGSYVLIQGIGRRFSGKYRIKKVSHTVDGSGYRTSFEVTQGGGNSIVSLLRKTLIDKPPPNREKRIDGSVTGMVTNNVDPLTLGRIQVKFPGYSDTNESSWARCATPMAGSGKGLFFLPDVGDEVLVTFENGDINKPLIIGSLWNGMAHPPVAHEDGMNAIRMLKTAAGHTITLDDTKGAEQLILKDKSGSTISLKHDGTVEISAAKKLVLASHGGISIEASEDLNVKCSGTLDLSASKKITLKADADISADAKNFKVTVVEKMDVS